jgi:predicted nucleic-acid-binding Zn-ribbon protein
MLILPIGRIRSRDDNYCKQYSRKPILLILIKLDHSTYICISISNCKYTIRYDKTEIYEELPGK